MATVATKGIVFKWNASTLGEVSGFNGLSAPSNKIGIGSFADTVLMTRPGRRKGGTLTLDLNVNPDDTTQAAALADKLSGVQREAIITFPEGTTNTITFNGRIANFTMSAGDDDIIKGQVTLTVTSVPVRSAV